MRGIFKLLDDTCKLQCQTSIHFVENILSSWSNHSVIVTPDPKNSPQKKNSGFEIRHFVGNVLYNAVSLKETIFYKSILFFKLIFFKTFSVFVSFSQKQQMCINLNHFVLYKNNMDVLKNRFDKNIFDNY